MKYKPWQATPALALPLHIVVDEVSEQLNRLFSSPLQATDETNGMNVLPVNVEPSMATAPIHKMYTLLVIN